MKEYKSMGINLTIEKYELLKALSERVDIPMSNLLRSCLPWGKMYFFMETCKEMKNESFLEEKLRFYKLISECTCKED